MGNLKIVITNRYQAQDQNLIKKLFNSLLVKYINIQRKKT